MGGQDSPAERVGPGAATYASAGVDIGAGDRAVDRMRAAVDATDRPGVLGSIGGFGGLFSLTAAGLVSDAAGESTGSAEPDPVLVSSADGVGTKLLVARRAGRYDTVGIDLVAMLVDDLVCTGAEPLFLLDYIAVGRLDPDRVAEVVAGVAAGCRIAGCALLGGETAEHPGAMAIDDLDLAGFAVGIVQRDEILGPQRVAAGDVLVGLSSPGLRSNGYSLARHVLFDRAGRSPDDPAYPGASCSLGEELLVPSEIYAPTVRAVLAEVPGALHAAAHITGGGLVGNIPRVLPAGHGARLERAAWSVPEIFSEIRRLGEVADEEMARVFNLGIGMVLVVAAERVQAVLGSIERSGRRGVVVGQVRPGTEGVELC